MVLKGADLRHFPLYLTLFILSAGILSVLAGCSISTPSFKRETSLHPPFKKAWEFRPSSREQFSDHLIEGDTFYYAAENKYGAVDLKTGLSIWDATFPTSESYQKKYLSKANDSLFIAVSHWALIACDPSSGQIRWSVPIVGYATPILAQDGKLFYENAQSGLACMEIATRTILWTLPFGKPSPGTCPNPDSWISARPLIAGGKLFIGRAGGEILAIDYNSGNTIWRAFPYANVCSSVVGFVHDESLLYISMSQGQVCAMDGKTGKLHWTFDCGSDIKSAPLIHSELLLMRTDRRKAVYGIHRKNGVQAWRRTIAGRMSEPCSNDGQILIAGSTMLYSIDSSGNTLWEWDFKDLISPDAYLKPYEHGYLLIDALHLDYLVEGVPPEQLLNAQGKIALAADLVSRIGHLSDHEERILAGLGDPAIEALFNIFREYLGFEDNIRENPGLDERFQAAYFVLETMLTPSHTPILLELLSMSEHSPPIGRSLVLNLLGTHGNELALPILQPEINSARKIIDKYGDEQYSHEYYVGINIMMRSSSPQAIQFLIGKMLDHNADPELRHKAFLALPNTGGAASLKAVLKAKDFRRTLPPLAELLHLENLVKSSIESALYDYDPEDNSFLKSRLLAEQFDDHGQRWGLVQSSAMGSGDLWIVKWDGGQWTDPIFTGVDLEEMKTSDWVQASAQDSTLRQDTDGDGWSDLIEGRLGTDALNSDTDGDLLVDSQDRNPLAAASPAGDTQEILAAAFEAAYRFYGWRPVPCIVEMPEGMEPFELSGWEGIILSKRHGNKLPLDAIERRGVGLIHFGLPQRDFGNDTLQKYRKGDVILWNKDRTEAKVHIIQGFGSLDAAGDDVHLKKFGKHWVAIEVKPIWAS